MVVEETLYTLAVQDSAIEIRDYPARIAAEVTVSGERAAAIKTGFRWLSSYIFGENSRQQSIAMTAPVIQLPLDQEANDQSEAETDSAAADKWLVRFIMPRSYKLETLPQPSDPRVSLLTLAASRYAVIRFSGLAKADDIAAKTDELNIFITLHALHIKGDPELVRYNPPWTLWFLRRNEIMIALHAESIE